jgi:subtilisin family serine protease
MKASTTRPTRRIAAAIAVLVTTAILSGGAASAATSPGGAWYADTLKLSEAQSADITGKGVTIAVLDGQINPDVPTLSAADLDVREPSFCYSSSGEPLPAATDELSLAKPTDHGTNTTSLIVGSGAGYGGQAGLIGVAPEATVLYYAVYTGENADGGLECLDKEGNIALPEGAALEQAIDDGADIVSMSLSVGPSNELIAAMARAYREGVIVVGSLRNALELDTSGNMPAGSNGAVSVQAGAADGNIQMTDGALNINADTDVVAPGVDILVQGNGASGSWEEQVNASGTSLATPIVAGLLALTKQKYPDATGNQLLQSLIHNTSGEPDHEPSFDSTLVYGYGLVSLTNLLATDPSKYPDVNPLIREVNESSDASLIPTYEQIFPPETPQSGDAGAGSGENASTDAGPWVTIALVVGGLVVVLIIGAIIFFTVRRARTPKSN